MNEQKTANYGVVDAAILKSVSGLEFLQGIISGKYPQPPIGERMDMRLVEIERGRAVFEATPGLGVYNPLGTVHGGFAATIMDSCMACSVQSMVEVGFGYTTIEFKITFVRPITVQTGLVRGVGEVVNVGRRLGVAEGRLLDANGKVLAHATTSCMIFPL
ncbi:MAG: PaaI family thioesterase [Betaproteobacteria bacterium]